LSELFLPSADSHILLVLIAGLAMLGMGYFPRLLDRRPMSVPILYILFGIVIFLLPSQIPTANPVENDFQSSLLEVATEILVITSLAGVGLAIDRPVGWKRWGITWRLLGITMPLCIIALGFLGHQFLGLSLAAAILLAGALAPTDPVLASDVQVAGPGEGNDEKDDVRFGLTTEAGLNDGLAFPFIHLAIALAAAPLSTGLAVQWLGYDVLFRIIIGIAGGFLVGRVVAWLAFQVTEEAHASHTNEGLVVISATFIAYGLTEIFHGYGFLATFVAAVTARQVEREHEYHRRTHKFIDQVERIMLSIMLIAFGGILVSGVLREVTWQMIAVALLFLLVVRPLAGWVGLIGATSANSREKLAISFFGIRGMGSLYYIAYGVNHADFENESIIWAMTCLVILLSIFIHGISASPIMRYLDLRRKEERRHGWRFWRFRHPVTDEDVKIRPGQPDAS
jgi:NhaP-type Na+/H+ or K+/H+ antiporter